MNDIDISACLHELSSLKQGWLDGKGIPPKASFIKWIDEMFTKHYPTHIQLPYIYPTPEGGIVLEWDDERYAGFIVEINPETRIGSLYALENREEKEIVETIELSRDGWQLIEKLLSKDASLINKK